MRCIRCEAENPSTNRFCGQCGSPLIPVATDAPASPVTPTTSQPGTAQPPRPMPVGPVSAAFFEDMSRQDQALNEFRENVSGTSTVSTTDVITPPVEAEPASANLPADPFFSDAPPRRDRPITGPSFLGLSEVGLSEDGTTGPVNYLYEDAPGPHRARYVIALLLALGFIAFVVYQWHQGRNWTTTVLTHYQHLRYGDAPPVTAAPTAPATAQAPPPTGSVHIADTVVPGGAPSLSTVASVSPKPVAPAPSSSPTKTPVAHDSADRAPARPAKLAAKASTPERTARPSDSGQQEARLLAQADTYLYGRGVPKSCSQAMHYLRAAANLGSAAARSKLGGLYATGNCVRLDRVEAYNWFMLAHDAGAKTAWNQQNREMLWNQMSPSEKARVLEPPH